MRVLEIVRLTGNSPSVLAGWPTIVNLVGSLEEIWNMEMVFEPGLTAMRVCGCISVEVSEEGGRTYVA